MNIFKSFGSITDFFNAIGTITTVTFWKRAGQLLLGVLMMAMGAGLLFRRGATGFVSVKRVGEGA